MVSDKERTKILEMIESGSITAEEGMTLLKALGESVDDASDNVSHAADSEKGEMEVLPEDPTPPDPEEIQRWKRWWVVPLWVGAGITAISGLLMYWAFSASGYGFWFACSWFPFFLGVALLVFAWSSRTAPWIHVRVQQAPGEKPQRIAISFPIPVRLTVWGLRLFGRYIPYLDGTSLDEVILALKDVTQDETPLIVDVDDTEEGERVQVFIG